MASKKVNSLKREYMKNRKRVQSYIREYRKYGYMDIENILPNIPKKITKASISRLEKITKKVFKEKLEKKELLTEYGELVTGKEAREVVKTRKQQIKEQKKAKIEPVKIDITPLIHPEARPAAYVTNYEVADVPLFDDIIQHYRELIDDMPDERWLSGRIAKNTQSLKDVLKSLLNDNYTEHGNAYVQHLRDNEQYLDEAVLGITYSSTSETYEVAMNSLLKLLAMGEKLTHSQAEALSDYGEFSGYNEYSDEYY